jgi:hypothetical protein
MQTIITKYLPATNHLPARIKAQTSYGNKSITVSVHHDIIKRVAGSLKAESIVAQMLVREKLNDSWSGTWTAGKIDNDRTVWTNTAVSVRAFEI